MRLAHTFFRVGMPRRLTAVSSLLWIVVPALLLSGMTPPSASAQSSGSPQLYFFTNDFCGPCKEIEPALLELAEAGYPITRVDTNVHRNWVEQFRVSSTPTVVFVSGNNELARHSGFIDAGTIMSWFSQAGFTPGNSDTASTNRQADPPRGAAPPRSAAPVQNRQEVQAVAPQPRSSASTSPYSLVSDRPVSEKEFIQQYSRLRNADVPTGLDATVHTGTDRPASEIEAIAMRATVRLRVEDPEGISFATGTVVHSHGGNWLVLTCGHVFRDSAGRGDIKIEYGFADGRSSVARGKLIDYDAEDRDVGLVEVYTGEDIEAVEIAGMHANAARGERVFSVGCDHGEDPTIRRTKIKNSAIYNGIAKYDIYGRPVDGRSGGGLFLNDGRLIGVCNAMAVDFDEGIYAAVDSVHWELAAAGLDHLFNGSTAVAGSRRNAVASAPVARDRITPAPRESIATNDLLTPDSPGVINRGTSRPAGYVQPLTTRGNQPESGTIPRSEQRPARLVTNPRLDGSQRTDRDRRSADHFDSDMEVIVIVRSRVEPMNSRAITLPDPSPELLNYLENVAPGSGAVARQPHRELDLARLRLPVQRVRYR